MRPEALFQGREPRDLAESVAFGQTRRMSLRARLIRVFLAALLCFSQQQAVLHLLGHDLSRLARSDATDPQELVCAKCLAVAHLDHAVPVAGLPPIVVRPAPVLVARVPDRSFEPAFTADYRSRAPPVFA